MKDLAMGTGTGAGAPSSRSDVVDDAIAALSHSSVRSRVRGRR
jgi:hypothetical protein